MNIKMNGKLIVYVLWPDGSKATADENCGLYFSGTYHGDRDEFWIVETDAENREVRRHNTRFVDSWEWAEPIDPE